MVLAVGWAAYLLPMLLKHHDDRSSSRPVDTFSDSVRVVNRAGTPAATPAPAAPAPASVDVPVAHRITRESARRAARRRRRVLAVLLVALVAVSATSYLALTPVWAPAIPAGLVVVFLVVARLTVRAQQVRRAAPVQSPVQSSETAPAEAVEPAPTSRAMAPAEVEPDLGREDTQGLSRDELAEAIAVPPLDEAGLWDPLPVTLPTYVNKARARRTVRTIEITGMTSSGHDAADSELARSAEEAARIEQATETDVEAEERKAAGA